MPTSALRVVDGAGHLVIEERPDELCREILAFLRA
jgi:pimeloyl-ACP methyl ester carboxylesterase